MFVLTKVLNIRNSEKLYKNNLHKKNLNFKTLEFKKNLNNFYYK